MSIQLIEGFDDITAGQLAECGYIVSGTLSLVSGRFGGNAVMLDSTSDSLGFYTPYTNLCAGVALMLSAGSSSTDTDTFEVVGAGEEASLFIDNGTSEAWFRIGGTNVHSLGVLAAGAWNYAEIAVDSSGGVAFRWNGVTVATSSAGGLAGAKSYVYLRGNPGTDPAFDDLYLKDDAVPLGDCVALVRHPDADQQAQWMPLSGSDNYAMVDENTPDGDASYVSSSVPGNIDYYRSGTAIPGAPIQIHATALRMQFRKDDTQVRQVRSKLRSGLGEASGATRTCSTSYVIRQDVFQTDPNTGTSWIQSAVQNSDMGIEEVT